MQAISLHPSGNQSMHKASHCDCNSFEPWYCSVVYNMPSWHLIPKVFFNPRRSVSTGGGGRVEVQMQSYKLMSARTLGQSIGVLCCQVFPQSTATTTRPNKQMESCYGLTVLPSACVHHHPPSRLSLPVLPPWSGGNREWGGTSTSTQHRRGKPPSCLIDFVFSG